MTKSLLAVGLLTIAAVAVGCAGADAPKVSAKADVAGTVTLDGKPMDEERGEISFAIGGEAPVVLPVKGGKFEGKVSVGENLVTVRALKKGEPIIMDGKPFGEPVDENYVAEKPLKANVPAGGAKDLKFDVETKK